MDIMLSALSKNSHQCLESSLIVTKREMLQHLGTRDARNFLQHPGQPLPQKDKDVTIWDPGLKPSMPWKQGFLCIAASSTLVHLRMIRRLHRALNHHLAAQWLSTFKFSFPKPGTSGTVLDIPYVPSPQQPTRMPPSRTWAPDLPHSPNQVLLEQFGTHCPCHREGNREAKAGLTWLSPTLLNSGLSHLYKVTRTHISFIRTSGTAGSGWPDKAKTWTA